MEEQVRSLLSDGAAEKPKQKKNANPGLLESEESDFSTKASPEAPAVPPCVREGIGRDETPLAVGLEPYRGQQAYIVVLPHHSGGTHVDAYAVDAACVEKNPPAPGEVIGTGTYER
ncbi:hypothetical protein F0L17_12925 [Streptomyces sp. TRM43335]|uniref:Uncharacterized protein n=1 Tax=Streptomyces taklimakanensis TaxID=2569853 RepID=A0A6G2BD66_9ACTN|nr:hypothetical protein [Streptomyces taklimakanensis]